MKRICIILLTIFTTTGLMAANEGDVTFNLSGGYGVTYTGGEVSTPAPAAEVESFNGYSIDIGFTYFTTIDSSFVFGISYQEKNIGFSWNGNEYKYIQNFLTLSAGYRKHFDGIFLGGGFFYSAPKGDWDLERDFASSSDDTIKVDENHEITGEVGLFLETGLSMPLSEDITFDLSLRFEGALNNGIKLKDTSTNNVEIRSRIIMIKAGISIFI